MHSASRTAHVQLCNHPESHNGPQAWVSVDQPAAPPLKCEMQRRSATWHAAVVNDGAKIEGSGPVAAKALRPDY